ncbi:hypothetical protein X798_01168 [Onchocerca flexuosa]|uniref:Uncharacterized protein n=2 Tax=Onchocerca flexuosa TaxID=387005 RepID=A0A183H9L8_9BILA|nr:hypothetical protein X798_01168 [Onchocerca flexuosa]VDO39200.1 unnamed protein product [Onchocerca flexuosa]
MPVLSRIRTINTKGIRISLRFSPGIPRNTDVIVITGHSFLLGHRTLTRFFPPHRSLRCIRIFELVRFLRRQLALDIISDFDIVEKRPR